MLNMPEYPDCSATLTAAELGRPFSMADEDGAPLAGPLRLAVEWDDDRFAEIDPATGCVVSVGQCAVSGERCAGRRTGDAVSADGHDASAEDSARCGRLAAGESQRATQIPSGFETLRRENHPVALAFDVVNALARSGLLRPDLTTPQKPKAVPTDDATPPGFAPIETLERENHPVAFALRTGEIVSGWMIVGVPTPQARTYWSVGEYDAAAQRRRVTPVYPIGWCKLGPLGDLPTERWR